MADEPTPADDPTPAPAPAADPAPSPAEPAPAPAPGDPAAPVEPKGEPSPADPVEPAPEASWPDDWRDRLAKGDDKALAKLKRYASPENVVAALLAAERKISSGEYKKGLSADASPEEVAAYRKANGLPEEATPEAYGVAFPEGFEASEADKAELGEFLGLAHNKNLSPDAVKGVWDFYLQTRQKAEQQAYEAAQDRTLESRSTLKAEWGRDYDRNVRIGDNFLAQQLGDGAKTLTGATLADGTKLGDHPDFVRFIVNAGLASADDNTMATAELSPGADLDAAYKAALDLKFSDPKTYHSPEHQTKLQRLAAARSKRAA